MRVGRRVKAYEPIEEPVEEEAAGEGPPTIEPEGELVEVGDQVIRLDRPVMRPGRAFRLPAPPIPLCAIDGLVDRGPRSCRSAGLCPSPVQKQAACDSDRND